MTSEDPTQRNRGYWNRTHAEYEAAHGRQLEEGPLAWGVWGVPEAELSILGDVAGLDVLELGCGAARWSLGLAERGARMVGVDLSERQLSRARELATEAGVDLPLVHGSAERAPFADASFDLVFCDHGALSFARPEATVAEASRLLRADGRFVFNMASPLHDLCWDPETDAVSPALVGDYFEMYRVEDDAAVCHQLPYGAWIRLFRRCGFVVEDLVEIRPPAGARTSYEDFVSLEWARRWPAENIWKLTKVRK